MRGSQSHELETDVPASELWKIYGTLRAAELLPELLPHILAKVELVTGDGGVGTIVRLTFPPGETVGCLQFRAVCLCPVGVSGDQHMLIEFENVTIFFYKFS
jgi:hypothetical protein